jgi:hypothetical protein
LHKTACSDPRQQEGGNNQDGGSRFFKPAHDVVVA